MLNSEVTRRGFLAGLGGLGAAAVLSSCATGSSDKNGAGAAGPLTVQSSLSDAAPKAALTAEKPATPKPQRARKPKPAAEPAVATAPVAKAPIPQWVFARPGEQLCMVEIAPPPPVQLSMAELLRSYGHIKEAATC